MFNISKIHTTFSGRHGWITHDYLFLFVCPGSWEIHLSKFNSIKRALFLKSTRSFHISFFNFFGRDIQLYRLFLDTNNS